MVDGLNLKLKWRHLMKRGPRSYSQCFTCSRLWDGNKEKCPHCGGRCLHYKTLVPLERTKGEATGRFLMALHSVKTKLPDLGLLDNRREG